jgi:hypothetical protein
MSENNWVGVNGGRGEKILGPSNIEFMMPESYKSALDWLSKGH